MKSLQIKATTPNGCSYKQPETGRVVKWETAWLSVERAIEDHRRAFNLTRGDRPPLDLDPGWKERFENDFCEQNQKLLYIEDGKSSARHITLEDVQRFVKELKEWVMAGRPGVPQDEAERRAQICASCPYNLHISGCFGCAQMAEYVSILGRNPPTTVDDNLNHCGHCGCALKALVHWPLELIADHPQLPEFCWRKK